MYFFNCSWDILFKCEKPSSEAHCQEKLNLPSPKACSSQLSLPWDDQNEHAGDR